MECSWCDNDADNDGKSESSLVAPKSNDFFRNRKYL